jgi:hypothetical protein
MKKRNDILDSQIEFHGRAEQYEMYLNMMKHGSPYGKKLEDPVLLDISHTYKPKFGLNNEQGYLLRERKRK